MLAEHGRVFSLAQMDRERSVMDGYRGFLLLGWEWLSTAATCQACLPFPRYGSHPLGDIGPAGDIRLRCLVPISCALKVVLPKVKVLSCVPKPCVVECPLGTEAAFCKLPGVCPTVTGFYQEHPELSGQFSQLGFGSWCWAKRCLEEHPGNVLAVNRAECIRA